MTSASVFFRVDASTQIGMGHLMRCLVLAAEMKKLGADVAFVCWGLSEELLELVLMSGNRFFEISEPNYSIELDSQKTLKVLKTQSVLPTWLVVDHYHLDSRWETAVKEGARFILAIDDLANRAHSADLILDQTLLSETKPRYDQLISTQSKLLLGPKFALLRDEFLVCRSSLKSRVGDFRKILVSFGGSDPTNETQKALLALREFGTRNLSVDVVIGAANPHWKGIKQFCRENQNFRFLRQVNHMAQLIADADLAIGAGGTSCWERCCLGLPALASILAKNQEEMLISLEQFGVLISLGWAKDLTPKSYVEALSRLDTSSLKSMSSQGMQLVDGKGKMRLTQELIKISDGLR